MALKGSRRPENIQQKRAYEHFVRLGAKASNKNFDIIAHEYQVSMHTIWNWYKKFNWKSRSQRKPKRGLKAVTTEEFRDIIHTATGQFKDKLDRAKVSIKHIQDLEKLVKIDALLQGKPTGDGTVVNIITAMPRPDAQAKEKDAKRKDPFERKSLKRFEKIEEKQLVPEEVSK